MDLLRFCYSDFAFLSQVCHDAECHQKPELFELVDVTLDWFDKHQRTEFRYRNYQGNAVLIAV